MKQSGTCSSFPDLCRVIRICLLLTLLALLGCGGESKSEVSGKVTYDGKAVTGGSLTFSPVAEEGNTNPGAPASTTVTADGSYSTSLVVPGNNTVTYFPPAMSYPEGHEPEPGEPLPTSGFEGLVPREEKVTIADGSNTIDIELVQKPGNR